MAEADKPKQELATFKMDDGSLVKADYEMLIKESDFFSSMFSGRFMENVKNVVELHYVDTETFKCVLDLLEKPHFKQYRLDVLLDAFLLSDRFLLTDLNLRLADWIKNSEMTPHTVSLIYKWAAETHLDCLKEQAVRFAFTCNCESNLKMQMFHELYGLGHTRELCSDIFNFMKKYLHTKK